MTTAEIENMGVAELKQRRLELVASMKEVPAEELATRYVQARTDAKMRDEKMAEQGKTIAELHSALDASRKTADEEAVTRAALGKNIDSMIAERNQLNEQLTASKGQLRSATDALGKVEALAKRRRTVLADITQLIAPMLVEE